MPVHALAFVGLLFAIMLATGFRGQSGLARAAGVTVINCLLGTAYVLTFDVYDPWQFFLAMNIASAWVVLLEPAGRAQAIVAGMYVALALLDAVYGVAALSGKSNLGAATSYIFNSAIVGWGQLSVLIIGAVDDDHGNSRLARWFGRHFSADIAAYFARMAEADTVPEA